MIDAADADPWQPCALDLGSGCSSFVDEAAGCSSFLDEAISTVSDAPAATRSSKGLKRKAVNSLPGQRACATHSVFA
jgi:hypothetical protein